MIKLGVNVGDLFLGLNIDSKNISKQISSAASQSQNLAQKAFRRLGGVIAATLSTAAVVSFGKSCLDLGSDLAEVQNVVDVTFSNMKAQVNDFAKNAINQFGLSETVAKRMIGTYGAMSKAFGFSESAAYDMASALTGLAGDVASFYNLDPSEAYTKLKSVFSGETESLKDLGVVMTQNALDQYALANGYGKTTSAMSEQEKVALRLAFVTNQLSAAGGDFARTSDSWANKVRVLSLNFQSLKATIGQGFINVLSPLISVLNTVIVKLQQAALWFTTFTSLLSGSKKTSTSLGSIEETISNASVGSKELANNVSDVGTAAKKAAKDMGALASFDELNNIKTASNTSSDDSSDSAIGNSGFGDSILPMDNIEAPDIDTSKMEASINKIKSMWSKFTSFFKKNGAKIISITAGIGAGFTAFAAIKNWTAITETASKGILLLKNSLFSLTDLMKNFTKYPNLITQSLTGISAPALLVVTAIAAVTASLVYLYQTSDSFRNLVNEAVSNLISILNNLWVSVLQPLFGLLSDAFNTVIIPLAEFIAKVVVKAVETITSVALEFWNNVLAPIADFLVDVLGIALQGVIDIWESWKPTIEMLFEKLDWLWNEILVPIVDWIKDTLITTFESWGDVIKDLIPSIKETFQGFVDFLVGIFTSDVDKAWDGIKEIFQGFDDFLTGIFTTDWTESFGSFGEILNSFFESAEDIWEGIKKTFSGIIEFINGVFSGDWEQAWEGVKDIFSGIFDTLAGVVKGPINAVIGIVNDAVDRINGFGFDVPDWVPFIGGQSFRVDVPKLQYLANGGYVKANTPQLAVIGDNKRYGEIVSPEDKMYDVMMSALKSYGSNNADRDDVQVLVSILYEILEAIKNLKLIVDGDSLNNDNRKRNIERSLRTGNLINV